jgi:N-acetylmuramidase
MNLADFQRWLNSHGANLIVDGKGGPKTRQAIFDVFTNLKSTPVSTQDIIHFAARLGGTTKQVMAVAKVEGGGAAYNKQGQPLALFERHYVWRRLKLIIPLLSNPSPGGYTIDADNDGLNDSWEKIADMAMRNPIVAFESASFGRFQIMGAWASKLGYANSIEFAYSMVASERGHYEAFVRYIEVFGGKAKFQAISTDWRTCTAFAQFYNGKGQKGYDRRIADAMK